MTRFTTFKFIFLIVIDEYLIMIIIECNDDNCDNNNNKDENVH